MPNPVRGRFWPASSVAALAVGVIAGCGAGEPTDTAPPASYVLDEQRGSFRGISLGTAERRVIARFGPDQGEPEGPVGPLGDDRFETGSPGNFASGPDAPSPTDRSASLRYPGMAFSTDDRAVYVIMSSLPGTRTSKDVGVGDGLAAARRAYPQLRCDEGSDAHGVPVFPYCGARLGPHRYLYFGADPIGTIAIAQVPLYG